jgi:hypothetical protein
MKGKTIINDSFILIPKLGAVVTYGKNTDASKNTISVPKDSTTGKWSNWGDDNLFPQNVLTDLEKNSIALRALEKRKNVHFGRGILPYKDIDGEKVFIKDIEVVDFFKINKINYNWPFLIGSLETFANAWTEMILNKEKTKINKIYIKDPAYCRWEKMDSNGRINNAFYSADWSNGSVERIPIPNYDPIKIKSNNTYADGNFVYPVFYRSFNKSYYHLAVWNGVRENSWMQIANNVPALKLAIMKNQMTIKYHIEIPNDYFTSRFPTPNYTKEQQEAERQKKIDELNDFLTNVENSGKAFVSFSFFDKNFKTEFPGWKINVIDNKLKDDAYLPDSQAANSEILFALGVDPTLIGGSGIPGGNKIGAGSGSDKREAFWQLNAEMGTYRAVSLEPLYFIRDFNGWDPEIQFDYLVVDTSQTQADHPTKINQNVDPNTQS